MHITHCSSKVFGFFFTLGVVAFMGSECSLRWLVVTDKVSPLLGNYDTHPECDDSRTNVNSRSCSTFSKESELELLATRITR